MSKALKITKGNKSITISEDSVTSNKRRRVGTFNGKPKYFLEFGQNFTSTDLNMKLPQDLDQLIDFDAYVTYKDGMTQKLPSSQIAYSTGIDKGRAVVYIPKNSSWGANTLYLVNVGDSGNSALAVAKIYFTSTND